MLLSSFICQLHHEEKTEWRWGKLTGNRKQDDLLIGPFFGCVVVDGDAAGGDLPAFFRPGDVPVPGVRHYFAVGLVEETHWKTTSEGK